MISYFELKELFEYDPVQGVLTWAMSRGFKKKGTRVSSNRVTINGARYKPGRIAWCLAYGRWPPKTFKHIDGDSKNIKLDNLGHYNTKRVPLKKPVTLSENWVRMKAVEGGYHVQITKFGGKPLDLGILADYDQACDVMRLALYVPDK